MITKPKKRSFWGWGNEKAEIDQNFVQKTKDFLRLTLQIKSFEEIESPRLEDLNLRKPRFVLPQNLASYCSTDTFERASHSFGKSFRDIWRALHKQFNNPPDYIAFPKTEAEIITLMDFAQKNRIALIPFGGGSSVSGGVEPTLNTNYQGVISLDMKYFNKVLEIDKTSRSARIQAGIFGPALEQSLKPEGFTLRHYPQSFEFSTLGGWIVTRSGGHYATLYTHIDEFVQAIRVITPRGIIETRRLPGSGAGPSEERLFSGSEGIFGIITEAWMRLQEIPQFKATVTVRFRDFQQGVTACRAIAQSGLYPTNARLISPLEAFSNGLGDGLSSVLIVGFESHRHPVNWILEKILEICQSHGGTWKNIKQQNDNKAEDNAAREWKKSFLQAPYLRDELVKAGLIVETFETATTWDKFDTFYQNINKAVAQAIQAICDKGTITCRFTHIYPDGPAPYFTIIAKGEKGKELDQWDKIKQIASEAIIQNGGTITHHHAVGKDHRPYYEQQRSKLTGNILAGIKKSLDPHWILNPDVLLKVEEKDSE